MHPTHNTVQHTTHNTRYAPRFAAAAEASDNGAAELPTLLSFYAEDVMRAVESEVRDVEAAVRARHPDALFSFASGP